MQNGPERCPFFLKLILWNKNAPLILKSVHTENKGLNLELVPGEYP